MVGYSPRTDTAVQYPVERTENRFSPVVQSCANRVFDTKPSRAGYWKFTWEAGHGESEWIDEDVRFDPARQLFVEKLTTRPYPGSAQFYCNPDPGSLTNFLEHLRKVAPDETEIEWLQGLIGKTPPNRIYSAGMVPIVDGKHKPIVLEFQSGATGAIAIEISTDSVFASALQSELQSWCPAN